MTHTARPAQDGHTTGKVRRPVTMPPAPIGTTPARTSKSRGLRRPARCRTRPRRDDAPSTLYHTDAASGSLDVVAGPGQHAPANAQTGAWSGLQPIAQVEARYIRSTDCRYTLTRAHLTRDRRHRTWPESRPWSRKRRPSHRLGCRLRRKVQGPSSLPWPRKGPT